MTISQILAAATTLELGQMATAMACGALTSPDGSLAGPLYRVLTELVEQERERRGLAEIDWPAMAKQELGFRFPKPAKRKGPQPVHLSLDGCEPETIGWLAGVLGQMRGHLQKMGEDDKAALCQGIARALDSQLPSRPSRGSAALN